MIHDMDIAETLDTELRQKEKRKLLLNELDIKIQKSIKKAARVKNSLQRNSNKEARR